MKPVRISKDVTPERFNEMMKVLPEGLVFKKSKKDKFLRDFIFSIEGDLPKKWGMNHGDTYVFGVLRS